uniref:Uncharacterized protein n=1 Tax=Cyanoptyche gloeocystis TaxID=77922 RepID=A0A7S2NPH8_9EUKA|mmetsp:Transcript_782/g.1389  ORF Transcript_782/g.1389 Transcript_782/m.1389 type:complete len:152 (+) Transcript_782:503-958(+)
MRVFHWTTVGFLDVWNVTINRGAIEYKAATCTVRSTNRNMYTGGVMGTAQARQVVQEPRRRDGDTTRTLVTSQRRKKACVTQADAPGACGALFSWCSLIFSTDGPIGIRCVAVGFKDGRWRPPKEQRSTVNTKDTKTEGPVEKKRGRSRAS